MWKHYRKQQPNDGAGGDGAGGAGAAGAGGGATPAWYGADTNKAVVEAKGFKSVDDVFTAYSNTEKLIGHEKAGRTIVRPKDEKDVEGIKAFRSALGVPESADKYELPIPDGDKGEFAKTASAWMHEIGVPKEQGQKLTAKWNEFVAKSLADSEAAVKAESEKQLTALKTEKGADFDKFAEQARRFMKASGWDDARIGLYESTFGTADMLKTFHALGAKIGGHEFVGGDGQGGGGTNAAQAKQQIATLKEQRIAGKVSDKDFHDKMAVLGPLAERAA